MLVLTFSMPFVTIAEQDSVMFETGADTAQNANTVVLKAEADAEQEASSDTNKIFWFGAGFAACTIGCPVGGCLGCGIGSIVDPSYFFDSTGQGIGGMVGLTAGVLIPIVRIYNNQPHLPPERLIGKSPEYVESYTSVYKTKARVLRTKLAVAGATTGCGLTILGCLVSVIEW